MLHMIGTDPRHRSGRCQWSQFPRPLSNSPLPRGACDRLRGPENLLGQPSIMAIDVLSEV